MDCREFRERLDEAVSEPGRFAPEGHASSCPACGLLLRRAALLGRVLGSLPPETPDPGLDRRVLAALGRREPRVLAVVGRVAAAALLLASGGIAALLGLSPGRARESLALKVVIETAAEGDAQELALEEMYGPRSAAESGGEGGAGASTR